MARFRRRWVGECFARNLLLARALRVTYTVEMDSQTLHGACHCGAVTFQVTKPAFTVACNCSICRRYATLWVHAPPATASVTGATKTYEWGDKDLVFHACATCNCITHWSSNRDDKIAVNIRNCPPIQIAEIPIRHFDGADTWTFLD